MPERRLIIDLTEEMAAKLEFEAQMHGKATIKGFLRVAVEQMITKINIENDIKSHFSVNAPLHFSVLVNAVNTDDPSENKSFNLLLTPGVVPGYSLEVREDPEPPMLP